MTDPGKYWHNNVDGSVHLAEALTAAGVRDVVFSSSCSVNGSRPMPVERAPPRSNPRASTPRRRRRWSASSVGTASPRACAPSASATSTPPGASHDAVIGEDWTYVDQPRPARHEGDARQAPAGAGVRRRLPDARRHGDPRLHPCRGPRRRHMFGQSTTSPVAISTLDPFNIGTGVGTSVMEVIRTTRRVSGQPVPYEIVSRRTGRPGDASTPIHRPPRRSWAGRPSTTSTTSSPPPGGGTAPRSERGPTRRPPGVGVPASRAGSRSPSDRGGAVPGAGQQA